MESSTSSTEDEPDSSISSEDRIEELEQITQDLNDQVQELQQRLRRKGEPPEGLWTPQQVADYLNVSKRTVERIIDRGRLNPLWIGEQRRFTPESVRGYVQEHCTSKGTG